MFLAHKLHFPVDFQACPESLHCKKALQQMRLDLQDGGSGHFKNVPIIAAASFGALATTTKLLHNGQIILPSQP
jgi:hypothetical protein